MKTFLVAAMALFLSAPSFARSQMHPYTYSTIEITALLQDKGVQAKLFPLNEMVESVQAIKGGWEIKMTSCRLEVTSTQVFVAPHPQPQGDEYKRVFTPGECR